MDVKLGSDCTTNTSVERTKELVLSGTNSFDVDTREKELEFIKKVLKSAVPTNEHDVEMKKILCEQELAKKSLEQEHQARMARIEADRRAAELAHYRKRSFIDRHMDKAIPLGVIACATAFTYRLFRD